MKKKKHFVWSKLVKWSHFVGLKSFKIYNFSHIFFVNLMKFFHSFCKKFQKRTFSNGTPCRIWFVFRIGERRWKLFESWKRIFVCVWDFWENQHSVEIMKNYSHSFWQNFVKITFKLKKLLKSQFDEISFWFERIFHLSTLWAVNFICILH